MFINSNYSVWLRITDKCAVPEMRIWSYCKGSLTIKYVTSQIFAIKFLVIPFAFKFAFKMNIKEKTFQLSIHQVNHMLSYQPVFYYDLKRVGVRDLEEYYNGLRYFVPHVPITGQFLNG